MPKLKRIRRPVGGVLTPIPVVEPNWKKKSSSFLARAQPMKGHGLLVYYSPPNFLFLSIKAFSFPCPLGTCMCLTMVACLVCRSLLCWINPSLLEKYLGVYCVRASAVWRGWEIGMGTVSWFFGQKSVFLIPMTHWELPCCVLFSFKNSINLSRSCPMGIL